MSDNSVRRRPQKPVDPALLVRVPAAPAGRPQRVLRSEDGDEHEHTETESESSVDEEEEEEETEEAETHEGVSQEETVEDPFLDELIVRLMTAPVKPDAKAASTAKKKVDFAPLISVKLEFAELERLCDMAMESFGKQAPSAMEEELQERYQHLLQPLRDVEANWDGSIKEYLGEYLDKLKADRERNLVAEDGEAIKFDFSMAAMLLQGSLRIFSLKVDHLHKEISEMYSSNKPKTKKGPNRANETKQDTLGADPFELLDPKGEMLDGMLTVQSLLAQNDKRRENVKPVGPGRIRERNCREYLVPLPISFIPNKKASPSAHYIQHVQNNEPMYVSQSEFFSLNSAAFPFALLDQQAEAVVRGHTVAVLLNIAYKDSLFEFSDNLSVGGRGRVRPRSTMTRPQTAQERRILDLIEEEPGEYEEAFGGFEDDDDAGAEIPPTDVQQAFLAADGSAGSVLLHEPVPAASLAITTNSEALSNRRPTRSGRPISVLSAATEVPELNVDDELAVQDEYATPPARQRPVVAEADKKKRKKKPYTSAKKQVEARDALIKARLEKKGQDYEQVSNDIRVYMATYMYSQKLARFGNVLDNSLVTLRKPSAQILNRVFYEQEKYEKKTVIKRKQDELEAARKKRREERALRKRLTEGSTKDADAD
ncbi:Condensin-2 complex subunit H2 [Aphelenchoides fujianensis]|nr:Condensin-2 complex subunit H2 [Aphelenchoides fujianensis]